MKKIKLLAPIAVAIATPLAVLPAVACNGNNKEEAKKIKVKLDKATSKVLTLDKTEAEVDKELTLKLAAKEEGHRIVADELAIYVDDALLPTDWYTCNYNDESTEASITIDAQDVFADITIKGQAEMIPAEEEQEWTEETTEFKHIEGYFPEEGQYPADDLGFEKYCTRTDIDPRSVLADDIAQTIFSRVWSLETVAKDEGSKLEVEVFEIGSKTPENAKGTIYSFSFAYHYEWSEDVSTTKEPDIRTKKVDVKVTNIPYFVEGGKNIGVRILSQLCYGADSFMKFVREKNWQNWGVEFHSNFNPDPQSKEYIEEDFELIANDSFADEKEMYENLRYICQLVEPNQGPFSLASSINSDVFKNRV